MPSICPSVFYLRMSHPLDSVDTFDKFSIKDLRNLTYVSNIKTNMNITTSVRLLCCYRIKGKPNDYCAARKNADAEITACSIRTTWTHFHLSPDSDPYIEDEDYLLSFVENSDFSSKISGILNELIDIVKKLGILRPIQYHIFTYGEPAFETSNNSHRDSIFDSAIKNIRKTIEPGAFLCPSENNCIFEKINISATNDLSFSLNNKKLVFHSS
jgi:hypothetical protein